MTDVIFYEAFIEEEKALKKFLPPNVSAQFTSKTLQQNQDSAPPASLISIRTQSIIPFAWRDQLKGVLTRSQGFDHIFALANETKIVCGRLDRYCSRAVAEHSIMVMLGLMRKLKTQTRKFETFNRDGITGRECKGKNVLVIGVGNIGSEIVEIVKGLQMPVKGVDIKQRVKDLQLVSLASGLAWAEIVFCTVPLTSVTKNMLNYDVLSRGKKGLVLINVSRGEITPMDDLKKLLDEGFLGGLGLDVFPDEQKLAHRLRNQQEIEPNDKIILDLYKSDQVIFTPHNAFNTEEATELKAKQSVEAVMSFLKKGRFPYPISSI